MITFILGKLSQQYCNCKVLKQCRTKVSRFPKFYQELIQLWSELDERNCSNTSEMCGELLWNNDLTVSKGETLYNQYFSKVF